MLSLPVSRNPLLLAWFRAAPKAECSGFFPGTIGPVQATETVKLILGRGEPLVGRLILYDALGMRFRELKLRHNPACPVCGKHPTITELNESQEFCGMP